MGARQHTLTNEPVWYSYHRKSYQGNAPWFYDPSEFPWTKEVEKNFLALKEEAERLIDTSGDQLMPYFNENLVDKEKSWSTLIFYFWGLRNESLVSPLFEEIFQSIPGFVSAAISKLEAGAEIKWHPGDTSGVIRCHLPLIVPGKLPDCGFQVMDEERSWEEGKMLMFCDAYKHRAFNRTNQDRFLLIIDIVHPDYAGKKKEIIEKARTILAMQKVLIKYPFLRKAPRFVHSLIRAYVCIYVSRQHN